VTHHDLIRAGIVSLLLAACSNGPTPPPPAAGAGGSGGSPGSSGGAGGTGGSPGPGAGGGAGGTASRDASVDRAAPSGSDGAVGSVPTGLGGVLTRGYNLKRTGANLTETVLAPAVVGPSTFGKLYCRPVDDEIYGQILYVPGVDLGPGGKHDVLYVVTMGDSVYAFDAADPSGPPLWDKHYADASKGITPVSTRDLAPGTCGAGAGGYTDITSNVGILSTPALDLGSATMYLVARTKESGRYLQRLHAISMLDGSERTGSPVTITATYQGTGAGNVGGTITFDPRRQNQRAELLLHDGVVLITWSSHCDDGPYHGWILGYDARTLQQVTKYMNTPNGINGGIWMSGMGPAVDDDGSIYLTTGNGRNTMVEAPAGDLGFKGGESILRLRPMGDTLSVMDWFTPSNYKTLELYDRDLGGCGTVLVPGSKLLVTGGKDGKIYVVDRSNLGHQTADDAQAIQVIQVTTPTAMPAGGGAHIHGTPVYWKSTDGEFIYVMAEQDFLRQYKITDGKLQLVKMSAIKAPVDPLRAMGNHYTMPGGIMSLSASGADPASGVLWVNMTIARDANNSTVPGVLRAFKASDVSTELWSSEMNASRDSYGLFAKFNPPTVYNGKVYLATFSKQFCVYGPLK
jgi:hypothetical protein